jgi:hypothetical protein
MDAESAGARDSNNGEREYMKKKVKQMMTSPVEMLPNRKNLFTCQYDLLWQLQKLLMNLLCTDC